MKTTDSMKKWREANPWVIVNVSSVGTACGRFPTREAAEEHAKTYRGGVVRVNETAKQVYVSEIPSC